MKPPHDSYWVIPGRLLAGPYPGAADEPTARAQLAAFAAAGVRCFVDLTEEHELEPYAHLAEAAGARHVRRPIRDVDIPTVDEMRETLTEIRAALAAGETVYVHCWGGVGRTGTVVGCLLVENGYSAADALAHLQSLRRGCLREHRPSPETAAQRHFVEAWRRQEGRTRHDP